MKEFPIALLDNLVAVMPESVQTSVIAMPDWQRSLFGKVIAKGPNTPEVVIGDRVNFGAASGMESVFNGASIRIMRETDILGVVEA